jgi:hypothetical protein
MAPALQRLRCTIYCLAGQVISAMDRPYDVAEPVCTCSLLWH